jgi:hypothetical protein
MTSSETSPEVPQPASSARAPSPAMDLWNRLSQGEQLALAGSAVMLVVGEWLLADLLGLGGLPLALEVAAADIVLLILVRAVRPSTAWPIPYAILLGGLATIVVVPSISDLLGTLRSLDLLGGTGDLLAMLINWLAAAAVGVGAWMVWRADRA